MNPFRKRFAVVSSAVLLATMAHSRATEPPSWPKAEPAAIANWRAKRFGMFIHFGPVSLTGKEISWSRGAETPIDVYDNLYKEI